MDVFIIAVCVFIFGWIVLGVSLKFKKQNERKDALVVENLSLKRKVQKMQQSFDIIREVATTNFDGFKEVPRG